jgi:signal transduction histidine kinase/CheY-like chemotaxis protein
MGSVKSGIYYTLFEEISEFSLSELSSLSEEKSKTFLGPYRGQTYAFNARVFPLPADGSKEDNFLFTMAAVVSDDRVDLGPLFQWDNHLAGVALLVLFTYLGWLFTRYLFRNLDEITEQAKLFTQGEHDIDIKVRSSDEIGILALTFQGMVRQVNERTRVLRKSERRIREARDQAEQALSSKSHLLEDLRSQKAEVERISKDKDDLLAIVSHDLKNPLAVVETSMDIILEEEKNRLSPMGNDLVRRSKNSARIALNLITDLLDLARLEGGIRLDFERFSVDDMIDSVVDSFYLKGKEKNIEIEVKKENDYDLIADYGRLIQVLSNILGNSLKFTPENGKITVNIEEYKTSHTFEGSNRGLLIRVTDTGPGIPLDKLDSIFDKFSQARKKDREIGTGLGLTICKNICELHNGEITASSETGKGATFVIKIPRLLNHEEKSENTPRKGQTVLVVNDDETFRKNIRSAFSQEGFNVLEAKNGEEMFQVLNNTFPQLVLLDDEMPVKNGLECLEELKERKIANLPIIYFSNTMNQETQNEWSNYLLDVLNYGCDVKEVVMRANTILRPDSLTSLDKKLDDSKKTVLIVDDEEGIRVLLHENFAFLGYNCITAKNGVEGLFLFQKYNVDLVISDIRMSEVDGLTLTKTLKKEFPDIPIILMSANIDNISLGLSERLGINKLFPKPFDIDELNEYVRETIGEASLEGRRKVLRKESFSFVPSEKEKKLNNTPKPSELEDDQILLVDDSEDMQTLFRVLLRKEDYKLKVAGNGKEAVDIFKKQNFKVIFMDMNMPIMGGEEAAKLMRDYEGENGSKKKAHLVLLTADQFDDVEDVKKLGFNSYIKKPLNKAKILKEIENA